MEGMNDNAAPPEASSPGMTVSSGTASEAMIRAATAASSADSGSGEGGGTPAQGTPAATGVAPASASPTGTDTGTIDPLAAVKPGGEAPPNRIEAAVRNARAEVEKQYAWAKDFSPSDVGNLKSALGLVRSLHENPKGFYEQMGRELAKQGLMTPPAQAQPAQSTQSYEDIEADLHSPDGKQHAFSDVKVRQAFQTVEERVTKKILYELGPLIDFYGNERDSRAEAGRRQQAANLSQQVMARVRQLPHFTEHETDITAMLQGMDPAERKSMGVIAALYHSYNQVLAQKVFPTIATLAEQRVRDANQKKIASSQGSIHPAQAGSGSVGKPALRNVQDLAAHMAEMANRASA